MTALTNSETESWQRSRQALEQKFEALVGRSGSVTASEALKRLQSLAIKYLGPVRSGSGLKYCQEELRALRDQLAPPNLNFTETDPKVGFEPVLGSARAIDTNYCLTNSFAFGGINASLILGKAPA